MKFRRDSLFPFPIEKITSKWIHSLVGFCICISIGSSLAAAPDLREASIKCGLSKTLNLVECDYRHSPVIGVKDVSLIVGGTTLQIPENGLVTYPAADQSTALFFIVDSSDPRRKKTVEEKNVKVIKEMIGLSKPHQKFGLAVFDGDLKVLSPLDQDAAAALNSLNKIKAQGLSTEFYKNILEAIKLLEKTEASRKGLIVISDGKAEDSAYKHEDVVKAARDSQVVILALGFLEAEKDSPYLQKLRRLSEDTFGAYYDLSNQQLPQIQSGKPFSFVEKGGRVSFDATSFRGINSVSLLLGTSEGKPIELTTEVNFPDRRTTAEYYLDLLKQYWYLLIAAVVFFIALAVLAVKFQKRKKFNSIQPVQPEPYAYLSELSGDQNSYGLVKNAIRIGRNIENDISLKNETISSHHAEIQRRRTGDVFIVDLASANGVFVNENKITQMQLINGDVIELGEVRLRFESI
jgi:hypothetical protein